MPQSCPAADGRLEGSDELGLDTGVVPTAGEVLEANAAGEELTAGEGATAFVVFAGGAANIPGVETTPRGTFEAVPFCALVAVVPGVAGICAVVAGNG